jgi:hypothetical protein
VNGLSDRTTGADGIVVVLVQSVLDSGTTDEQVISDLLVLLVRGLVVGEVEDRKRRCCVVGHGPSSHVGEGDSRAWVANHVGVLLDVAGGMAASDNCLRSRVEGGLSSHGECSSRALVASDVVIVVVDIADTLAVSDNLLRRQIGGQDVLRERRDVRSVHALHVLDSSGVNNAPAHDAEIIISGNDADQRTGESQKLVERCSMLGVALADDRVSLSEDAPLGLERVVLPHACQKATDVLLLERLEDGRVMN